MNVPFETDLPILAHRLEITKALSDHQVLVVAGETGSGKSTQLPKICLAAGFGARGMIGHTQPRRIAARTIASRIAAELGSSLGQLVGFKVRFDDGTSESTRIKLMTDGILLAETQADRNLERYEVIIIDEAHERSLNIDFLLGLLQRMLKRRRDLRLIVTSATIDAQRFADYYSDAGFPAPVIEVSGRTYPVDVQFYPLTREARQDELRVQDAIAQVATDLVRTDRGDILVFLPTERDIRETARRLRGELLAKQGSAPIEIVPLYARLSAAEQAHVFETRGQRRIVLATNVAESSLTVPNIRFVIDTGTARISRYSPRSKVQRLPIEAISRASADQRAGRCGRVEAGVCIRLYSEEDYHGRAPYTTPEIQRTNLASVILQAKALNLGEVAEFPFLDPPRKETIRDGYRTLFEIGAIDADDQLTPLGREMARLPIDPRLARLVLAGREYGCLPEILVLAAALEVQDPRERPLDRQQRADEFHSRYIDEQSDFVGLLKLWDFYHHLKKTLSRNQLRRACSENFLSFARMREWTETHRQLCELERRIAYRSAERRRRTKEAATSDTATPGLGLPDRDRYAAIHQALLTGFLSGIAMRKSPVEYIGAGGITFNLWPGSGLFSRKPLWCMAAEIVETNRRYGRIVAEIRPEWIEPLATHLVKVTYHDPHWHYRRCEAMAFERVSLFGLPIVARRHVPYGHLDHETARELFLRDGLKHDHPLTAQDAVAGLDEQPETNVRKRRKSAAVAQFVTHDQARIRKTMVRNDRLAAEPFFQHNQRLLEQAARIAARSRNADAMIDDYAIYRFYDSRIPPEVIDLKSLQSWIHEERPKRMELLKMSIHEFLSIGSDETLSDQFPDVLQVDRLELPLDYRFAPGETDDGVTVVVPAEGLRQLHSGRTAWLVPGLIEEKIATLIRSLPKNLRTNFIPAPDVARRIAAEMPFGRGNFLAELVRRLNAISKDVIREEDFDLSRLPVHLQMNIRVVDSVGKVQAEGRDASELLGQLGIEGSPEIDSTEIEANWHRDRVTEWDFGNIAAEVPMMRGSIRIVGYPTVVDAGDCVRLRIYDRRLDAERALRGGVRRLYAISQQQALRAQLSWLPGWNVWSVYAAPVLPVDKLRAHVGDLLIQRAFLPDEAPPRTEQAFRARLTDASERLALATQDVAKLLPKLFRAYHEVRLAREELTSISGGTQPTGRSTDRQLVLDDLDEQIHELFAGQFLVDTPWPWLQEYPRYFRAIVYRLERLPPKLPDRDRQVIEEIQSFWREYQIRRQSQEVSGIENPELIQFRWMIEEYRVSQFAQALGTRYSVSAARLKRQLDKAIEGH